MKKQAIIVDLDGTLSNSSHRQHFMAGEKKDWKSFYESLVQDPPHGWCQSLVARFIVDHDIILVSGRPEDYRPHTTEWLSRHGIPYHQLHMRPSGDFRKDCILKKEIYHEKIEPYFQIKFCVDDRRQVVDMWRSLGLTCLQCADGEF